MAHESFEDDEVAYVLNKNFIPVKVDKEERPDVDSIYMTVCQTMTGSGGWPLTILLAPDKKPFFAATYIPKHAKYNSRGLIDLLEEINNKWLGNKKSLLQYSESLISVVIKNMSNTSGGNLSNLTDTATNKLKASYDKKYGGFGSAPKFPTPHNIIFLLEYYKLRANTETLEIADTTLTSMYRGGIFDHIGYGFSRYSTDDKWLAPHFEKMLYDNALLIHAYTMAYEVTGNNLYKNIAMKTIKYVFNELTDVNGGFYCAQDADSEGEEGRYYLFTPGEVTDLLGNETGNKFNEYYGITEKGNFEGKNIPNLIGREIIDDRMDEYLPTVYKYRKNRMELHRDDKILTSWNGMMIAGLAEAYSAFGQDEYLRNALNAVSFIKANLMENDYLFASYRDEVRSSCGFIDDYAFFIYGLIELYRATYANEHIHLADKLMRKALDELWDDENHGFHIYGRSGEQLFINPKETYDGATPSGNSVMAYNLFMLQRITKDIYYEKYLADQISFMDKECGRYPHAHCFYMYASLLINNPPREIVCVLQDEGSRSSVLSSLPKSAIITVLESETDEYRLLNNKTTYYVCENNACLPPVNELV